MCTARLAFHDNLREIKLVLHSYEGAGAGADTYLPLDTFRN